MDDDAKYATGLLRLLVAEQYFSLGMQASREMFGKSYMALGAGEKVAVDQAVQGVVVANYHMLTPEFLQGQTQNPIGFQSPTPAQETKAKS